MRKSLLLFAFLPLSVATAQTTTKPAAPVASMTPNPPAKIVAATMDCWAATGGAKVDRTQLDRRGWKAGKLASADGKTIASPLTFYGKADSGVVILLSSDAKASGACTVLSPVASPAELGQVASQLETAVKAVVPGATSTKTQTAVLFTGNNRVALLEGAGSKEKPAARIIVATKAVVEKK